MLARAPLYPLLPRGCLAQIRDVLTQPEVYAAVHEAVAGRLARVYGRSYGGNPQTAVDAVEAALTRVAASQTGSEDSGWRR